MLLLFQYSLVVLIGLAGGLAVGSGLVAFVTVLDIIPRLTQLIKGFRYMKWFERALVSGAVIFTWIDLREIIFHLPKILIFIFGAFSGIFVGMLAGALTEVLNVLPILAKRVNMANAILFLLMAMVFGKIAGSLIHWLIYVPNS
ncbi:stage V sporulation protein AB [Tepidibacillus infernus]|uniref:Stage V sporulation protein AB n=1 Tax=Tepidibacillus decaturensis TaxID=1413211 RepID=A0A135L390_9BACI|nr:stage V sporulation protein AB [Tepidibacillus decaturensis]KXG43349.1 stage V sporulation protein AB [Tepidibacillus decaturensis]